jgi:hypothetical protein
MPIQEKDNEVYQKLIIDHLQYIEKQCRKACGVYTRRAHSPSPGNKKFDDIGVHGIHIEASGEIDADTLVNKVIDHLTVDDYRVLRQFKNLSKLTTYITTIIANLVVDIISVSGIAKGTKSGIGGSFVNRGRT